MTDEQYVVDARNEMFRGIEVWRTHANWRQDFHNGEYQRWAREFPHGDFSLGNFGPMARTLRAWQAPRPITDATIRERYANVISELNGAWKQSIEPVLGEDISTVRWEQIEAFTDVVSQIKPGRKPSAVFTSKFCHFLVPSVFPVVDNAALGLGTKPYRESFRAVQDIWVATPQLLREQLTDALRDQILLRGGPLYDAYPFANKIVELRLIGRR